MRDYVHVSDLADIHIKSLSHINAKSKSIVLNCGYGKGYSVLDIVNIFKKMFRCGCKYIWMHSKVFTPLQKDCYDFYIIIQRIFHKF